MITLTLIPARPIPRRRLPRPTHAHAANHAGAGGHASDPHAHDAHGSTASPLPHSSVRDLSLREVLCLAPLVVFMVWIGLDPDFFTSRDADGARSGRSGGLRAVRGLLQRRGCRAARGQIGSDGIPLRHCTAAGDAFRNPPGPVAGGWSTSRQQCRRRRGTCPGGGPCPLKPSTCCSPRSS